MHIPNGFLSDPVCAATTAAAAASLGVGFWQTRRTFELGHCGKLAAMGTAIFAIQMVNFPIDHGTSGHLIGAALATMVLGPWGAMLCMSTVLAIQAIVFGDGGMATFGANVLNMAVVAPWTAWGIYRLATPWSDSKRTVVLVAGLAGITATLAATTSCSLELALGGAGRFSEVLPAMLKAHLLVGLSEGLLTAALVLALSERTGLAISPAPTSRPKHSRGWIAAFGALAAMVLLLAPWASSLPDGLEHVAERLGFSQLATTGFSGLVPDYILPGIDWLPLAVAMAGVLGVIVVFAAAYAVGCMVSCGVPKRPQ